MRQHLRSHLHQALALAVVALILFTLLPASPLTSVADARVTPGGAFGSAVACLNNPDQFVTTRFANTIYTTAGYSPPSTPAVQTFSAGGTPQTLAIVGDVGAVYGLAYDDGAVSGRERIFAATYTKRLSGNSSYDADGTASIFMFQRSGGAWSAPVRFPATNVSSHPINALRSLTDVDTIDDVSKRTIGDMEVSPDGRALYLVNIARKQIEVFDLTAGGTPSYLRSIPINLGVISGVPAVQADLWPFALEFFPYRVGNSANELILNVGVTDSAQRGLVGGKPGMTGTAFTVSPRAYVLNYNLTTTNPANVWGIALNQDLGNSAALENRHIGSTWDQTQGSAATAFGYADKPWYPWQDQLDAIPRQARAVYYPQPLLTDIEFVSERVPTQTPAFTTGPTPWPMMVLGIRDRTGDQAFNGNAPVPATDYAATAQGDTLAYRLTGSAWTLQGGEVYDDNTHLYPGPVPGHLENHMGALASVPSRGLTLDAFAETLATTTLAGSGQQAVRIFDNAGSTGGAGTDTLLIAGGTTAATKATNLGDMELLCSYALVGGRVWHDVNFDGVQGGGDTGMSGIALDVILNPTTPSSAPTVASATTDASGRYLFAVPANTNLGIRIAARSRTTLGQNLYRITRQNVNGAPGSLGDNTDSDISAPWGIIEFQQSGTGFTGAAITAPWRESDERRYDIGLTQAVPTGQIGDRVWVDANGDGDQDAGDPGLAGQPVTLNIGATAAPIPANIVRNVTTDASGNYRFLELPPGQYQVQFALPANYSATLRDQGGDDARDSDADAASGFATGWFTLADSQVDTSRDFGVRSSADVSIVKTGAATALIGGTIGYTLRVQNLSTSTAATNVVVVDTLPLGTTYSNATPRPTTVNGRIVTWNLGTIVPNDYVLINLSAQAPLVFDPPTASSQVVRNCANVTAPNDPNPANDNSCANTTLNRIELGIIKTASADPVIIGDTFTYALTYGNTGSTPAGSIIISDQLPVGLTFVAFTQRPTGCSRFNNVVGGQTRTTVRCTGLTLAVGASGTVAFTVRADPATMPANSTSVANTATISSGAGPLPGDDPSNNSSTVTTAILFPDPSVTITIDPTQSPVGATTPQFPVGSDGLIRIGYGNGGTGFARGSVITATLDTRLTLGTLPSGCTLLGAPSLRVRCTVGDLATGAAGTGSLVLPVTLPASFPDDMLTASAIIASTTPERVAAQGNNSATSTALAMRPNVYTTVTAVNKSAPERGAAGWRSFVRFQLGYGNDVANPDPRRTAAERARPSDRTWPAAGTVLTATLPLDTTLDRVTDATGTPITGYTTATDGSGRTTLTFALNTLAPRATGGLFITVLAGANPGVQLELSSVISAATPGDDLADNTARDATGVAAPPTSIEPVDGAIRLAIRSELDPNSQDGNPTNGVYLSDGPEITWPAGEVLDFTPRLMELDIPDMVDSSDPLYPYGYYARVSGWSVTSFTVNGTSYDAETRADSAGKRGCRAGNRLSDGSTTLPGCGYVYAGATAGTVPPSEALPPFVLTEAELARQAHAYWTNPPLPSMRDDVYTYAVAPLAPVQITVAVEVEVEVVNLAPCAPLGDWTCAPVRDPAFPVERQILTQTFTINLLVPRSIVGPGGARSETGTTQGR